MAKMRRPVRRAAKAADVFFVDFGNLLGHAPIYGLPVECYVCGAPHTASGIAIIQYNDQSTNVPLREPCFANRQDDVTRIFLRNPDIRIIDGSEITDEQSDALVDKQNATAH